MAETVKAETIPSSPAVSTTPRADSVSHPFPDPSIGVVLPACNNELVIGSLVLLCRQYAGHVIVVDNDSTDRTAEVAVHAGADVIHIGEYAGGGGRVLSILAGCRKALTNGCTAVVLIDSEGKHLTREIPRLAGPVLTGKADCVIGSRNLSGRKGIPAYQLDTTGKALEMPEKTTAFLATDPGSTFRALNAKAISLIDVLPETDIFEESMNELFLKKGLRLREIPVMLRHEAPARDDEDLPLYCGHKVAVVVPAYNEELLIGETLKGIPDFVCHVYVVDDCSKDRTREVIQYYAERDPSIVPIFHEVNKGPGGAITSGYKRAYDDGMDIVATMDGDNQMDPAFLPQLLDPIVMRKCDFTMGNRLVNREFRRGMSTWRLFGNTMLTLLTKIASGYWSMVDPQNGFTAISRRALERIDVNSMYPRYGYLNDRLVRLNMWGFRVINIPHPARYGKETSGIKYPTYIYRVSQLLLKDFIWRLELKYIALSFHPLVFFYVSGVFFTGLAFLLGLYSLFYKFIETKPIFIPAALTLILLILGLQSIFFAMVFDMQQEKADNGWY